MKKILVTIAGWTGIIFGLALSIAPGGWLFGLPIAIASYYWMSDTAYGGGFPDTEEGRAARAEYYRYLSEDFCR